MVKINCNHFAVCEETCSADSGFKNSDKGATGNVAGVLLYVKTDEAISPNNDFNIGGNRISLKTLDLNREWSVITEQLDKLCAWLGSEECA
jgi:hypothetical protein